MNGIRGLIEQLGAALIDPARRERTAVGVLAAYVFLWTVYGVIAKFGQGVQFDAAEIVVWSRELAWGYTKHPPLAAWVVRLWFTFFPVADWSYYLFAMTYSAGGLWIAWRLFGYFLDPRKRVVALALLTLVPMYNFHSLRFDLNACLPLLWGAAALCFIRSFDTRSDGWAVLAGITGAAAMLGKYWSIFLLAGLALAAVLDPRRGAYFRSRAPWITITVGALLLAPNLIWLVQHDFSPMTYVVATRSTASVIDTIGYVAGYIAGGVGYMAAPLLVALAASRPPVGAIADIFIPQSPQRRFIAIALWAPLLLPVALALASGLELNSLWIMAGFTLLPVVLLSSPLVAIDERAMRNVLAGVILVPVALVVASPAIAIAVYRAGLNPAAMYGKMLAEQMQTEWRKSTDRPLLLTGGDFDLSFVTAFYLPDRPSAFPLGEPEVAPWADAARIERQGIALACHIDLESEISGCSNQRLRETMEPMLARHPIVHRTDKTLKQSFLGVEGRPVRFLIVIIPPKINGQHAGRIEAPPGP